MVRIYTIETSLPGKNVKILLTLFYLAEIYKYSIFETTLPGKDI